MNSQMPQNFFGRETELAKIQKQWEAIVSGKNESKSVSNILVITGSTGEGKTRLVQRFYETLANDAAWNPTEKAYWPTKFQEDERYLRANPDMEVHQPAGPPRFIWLGMRWQNRELRNLEERRCPIPEVRKELRLHNDQIKKHKTIWEKLWGVAKPEMFGGVKESALEKIIEYLPINGFALKVIGTFGKIVHETNQLNKSRKEKTEELKAGDIEALIDDLEIYFASKVALPLILFLDDAQWIDESTLKFIDIFANEVRNKKLPVFMVITHWVAEWNELIEKPESLNLRSICESHKAQVLDLGFVDNEIMRKFLLSKLSGLNYNQQQALIEKSCNNFLSLEENIGYLLDTPENFVDEKLTMPLSEIGEKEIAALESDRTKRIQNQFNKLEKDAKRVLGWSSQLGVKFLADIIESVAKQETLASNLKVTFNKVEQRAYISPVNTYFKEFRDRAIFKLAQKYFMTYDAQMESSIQEAIKGNSIWLIQNSFDEVGSVNLDKFAEEDEFMFFINNAIDELKSGKKSHDKLIHYELGIMGIEPTERRDILGMTLQAIGLPDKRKQNKDEYTLSTRTLVLDFLNDWSSDLLGAAKQKAERFKDINWDYLVADGIGWHQRLKLADACNKIQAYQVSLLLLDQLKMDQNFCKEFYEESIDVKVEFNHLLADCLENTGRGQEGFEVRKKVINELEKLVSNGNADFYTTKLFYNALKEMTKNDLAIRDQFDFGILFAKVAEKFEAYYVNAKRNRKNPEYLVMAIKCWNRKLFYDNEECAPEIDVTSFKKAKSLALQIFSKGKNPQAIIELFNIYKNAAEVFCRFGKRKASKKCLNKMKKCLNYNEKTFTQDSIKDLYVDLENAIGNFHYRFGNFKKSVSQFKVNYSQAKLDWEEKNSIENLYQYASKSFDLGNNYYLGGKYKKALVYMYESYGLHEKLFLQKKEIYIFENILRIVRAISDCETVPPQGDFDKLLTNVLPVFEDTFEIPDNKSSLFLLATLLGNCGKALILLKAYQKSKYLLEKAISFFSIIQDPLNMPESCRSEHGPIGVLGIVEIYLGNIQRGNELYLEFKNKAKIRGYHDFIGVLGQYCDAYTDCQVDSMSYMVRVDYLNYFEKLYRSDPSPETLEEMIGAKIYLTKATADDPQKTSEILGEVAEDLENLGNSFPNPSLESLKRAFELAKNGWVDNDLPE
jgi:hypothetical protein